MEVSSQSMDAIFLTPDSSALSIPDTDFLLFPELSDLNLNLNLSTTESLTVIETNINSSSTGSRSKVTGRLVERNWIFIGLSILPFCILFGNILVLVSVVGFRHLRTLSNWVIASLALTDFLLAVSVVPLSIYQMINDSWDLGFGACLFWTGSDVFLSTASIMHLCAIAIHRHLGIAYPLRMRHVAQNRRHALCLLVPVWAVSAAVSASLVVQAALDLHPVLVVVNQTSETGSDLEDTAANRKWTCGIYDRTFAIYSSMVSFFVPLAVMIAVDFRSVQILRSVRRDALLGRIINNTVNSSDFPTPLSSSASTRTTTTPVSERPDIGKELSVTRALTVNSSLTSVNDVEVAFQLKVAGNAAACKVATLSGSSCRPSDIVHQSSSLSNCVHSRRSRFTNESSSTLERRPEVDQPVTTTVASRLNGSAERVRRTGYGRFTSMSSTGNASMSIVNGVGSKLSSRERRAGRTLIWVFVIFVALWLPFFCANLAYGFCGQSHVTRRPTPVTRDDGGDDAISGWQLMSGDTRCVPETALLSFTWLGYVSSGVNPLLYTVLNADFQNAFRVVLTCGYRGSASSRMSRSNMFG